ncbi:MAG: hypothetical protein ACI9MC_002346 [Kiritimatiellia bacterium]|jgi:hypothetical protein
MKLNDAAESIRVRVPPTEAGGPYVGLEHFVPHDARLTGCADAAQIRSATLRFEAGDVLFGALRPGQGKLTIAANAGVCSTEILVLRPRASLGFLLGWLMDPAFLTWCEGASRGTRMPRVRWQDMAQHRRPNLRDDVTAHARAIQLVQERLTLLHRRDKSVRQLIQTAASSVRQTRCGPTLSEIARRLPESRRATVDQPLIHLTDIDPHQATIHRWRRQVPRGSYTLVHPGDLLVGRLRPALNKTAVCPVQGACTPELWALRAEREWSAVVLAHCTQPSVVRSLVDSASGTRMPRARWSAISHTHTGFSADAAARLERAMRPATHHLAHSPALGKHLRQLRSHLVRRMWRPTQQATRTPTG